MFIYAADGSVAGAVAPAWARDARGLPVPSRYELDGNVLTQVVEHTAADAYPVVADPWLGINLFRSVTTGYYQGFIKISAGLSWWGYAIFEPLNASGKLILKTAGWDELKRRQPVVTWRPSIRQQYDCHVLGGHIWAGAGTTWDLESVRRDFPGWVWSVGSHRCNW